MGRPLFSKLYQVTPAVREPEPPCPHEKWSYLNNFDPDADEFFENAEYEAFVEAADVAAQEEQERDEVVVIRVGNTSPTFSEESLSDRASPMAVGDDPARLIADAYGSIRTGESALREELRRAPPRGSVGPERRSSSDLVSPSTSAFLNDRPPNPSRPSIARVEFPRNTVSPPIARPHRRASVAVPSVDEIFTPSTPLRNSPSTPPSHQTPLTQVSPSPPPFATPRLYSWSSHPRVIPASPSVGMGPLTNSSARMSYAHLAPLVRVQNIMT